MKIQPIVEGHGEVQALPVLLRRLRDENDLAGFDIGTPIRKKHDQLIRKETLQEAIHLARLQEDCAAILVLFEAEDDCPKKLGPQLLAWVKEAAGAIPSAVALAHREYETWFLAAMTSLRGKRGIRPNAEVLPNPEMPRDAKKKLEQQMRAGKTYKETIDQAPLSALFDLKSAYGNSRSFRHLIKMFGELVSGMGIEVPSWPPLGWTINLSQESS